MGMSSWPGMEIDPIDQRVVLREARLRVFGVNYLQGAICPELGLLAHPEGSSVLLLSLRRDGSDRSDMQCVGKIELLRASRTAEDCFSHESKRDVGGKEAPAAAASPARPPQPSPSLGVSWSRYQASSRGRKWSTPQFPPGLAGSSDGAYIHEGGARAIRGMMSGPQDDDGQGEVVFSHLAVADGSAVRLWRVSRRIADPEGGGGGDRREFGCLHVGYRFETAEVQTGLECRGANDGDSGGGAKDAVSGENSHPTGRIVEGELRAGARRAPGGQPLHGRSGTEETGCSIAPGGVRCLSFQPLFRGAAAKAPLLATWRDNNGAMVLGSGGTRKVYAPPVAKRRVCGAWSGCGRRLAVSSGGEIRVYHCNRGSGQERGYAESSRCPRPHETPQNQDQSSSKIHAIASDSRTRDERQAQEAVAVEAGDSPTARGPLAGGESSAVDVTGSFRTVLVVEAALQEDRATSSPGSSPRSASSFPPPPQWPTWPTSCWPGDNGGTMGPTSDAHPVSRTTRRTRAQLYRNRHMKSSSLSATRLIGDMRSMCPAGPLAFFGVTDCGLGLEAFLGGGSGNQELVTGEYTPLETVPGDSTARASPTSAAYADAGTGTGSVVLDAGGSGSSATTPATARWQTSARNEGGDSGGGGGGGFQHVLPGENWLAGSIRLQSMDFKTEHSASSALRSDSVVAATRQTLTTSPSPSLSISHFAPTQAPEIVDLRGKLGKWPGSIGSNADSTHPLFRLSLGTGMNTTPLPLSSIGGGSRMNPASVSTTTTAAVASDARRNFDRSAAAATETGSGRPLLLLVTSAAAQGAAYGKSLEGGGGREGRGEGVKVQTLASLPPALSSPDLLAASHDGQFVAVGSHALGLVACYRLSSHSATIEPVPASDYHSRISNAGARVPSANELLALGARASGLPGCCASARARRGGHGKVDRGGHQRRRLQNRRRGRGRRSKRQAVPLCTLRLPPGYRAKGLAFVDPVVPERQMMVLVLAACPVSSSVPDTNTAAWTKSAFPTASELPGAPRWRQRRSSRVDSSFCTVLLRFLLPMEANRKGKKAMSGSPPSRSGTKPPLAFVGTDTLPPPPGGKMRGIGNRGMRGHHLGLFEPSPFFTPAEPLNVTDEVASRETKNHQPEQFARSSFLSPAEPLAVVHEDLTRGTLGHQPGLVGPNPFLTPADLLALDVPAVNAPGDVRGEGDAELEHGSLHASPEETTRRGGRNNHTFREEGMFTIVPPLEKGRTQAANAAATTYSGSQRGKEEDSLRQVCEQLGPSTEWLTSLSRAPQDTIKAHPDSSLSSTCHDGGIFLARGQQRAGDADRVEPVVDSGFGKRNEALFLDALARVEKGIGERLERMERVLVGLSDRVGSLERSLADRGVHAVDS